MIAPTTIPVRILPEAAARIAALGFQAPVDQMIEHARNLPGVVRVEVVLNDRYDMSGEPGVAVDAYSDRPFDPADRTASDLARWAVTTFPPEVLEHLHLSWIPGAGRVACSVPGT
jgi:hypothetical protein